MNPNVAYAYVEVSKNYRNLSGKLRRKGDLRLVIAIRQFYGDEAFDAVLKLGREQGFRQ